MRTLRKTAYTQEFAMMDGSCGVQGTRTTCSGTYGGIFDTSSNTQHFGTNATSIASNAEIDLSNANETKVGPFTYAYGTSDLGN